MRAFGLDIQSSIFLLGALALMCETMIVGTARSKLSEHGVLRLYGTTLIIIIVGVIATGDFSEQQLTPIVGLMGTIIGYLLGKTDKAEEA